MRAIGRKAGYSLAPLGFMRPRGGLLVGIGVGVAVGVGAIIVSVIVSVLERPRLRTARLLDRVDGPAAVYARPRRLGERSPGLAIPAIILVVVLFGPAVEELVFRGAVFNGLYRLGL